VLENHPAMVTWLLVPITSISRSLPDWTNHRF